MISEIDIRDWGKEPIKPIDSAAQYEHYLQHFDWQYEHTDDYSVWKRWDTARLYLVEATSQYDPYLILWKRYAPSR
jgi:hypothetical protein